MAGFLNPTMNQNWLPQFSVTLGADSAQSAASVESQMPKPYYLPEGNSQYSSAGSRYGSPHLPYSIPTYQQQTVPGAYNPPPINHEQPFHRPNLPYGVIHPNTQVNGYGQQSEGINSQGSTNSGDLPPQLQAGQPNGHLAPQGFWPYAPQMPKTSGQYPQYSVQPPMNVAQGNFSGQQYPHEHQQNGYQQQYIQPQPIYLPQQNNMAGILQYQNNPNGHQGNGRNLSVYAGDRSASAQSFALGYTSDEPPYKSSGFVPPNVKQKLPHHGSGQTQKAKANGRTHTPFVQRNAPWGEQYKYHGSQMNGQASAHARVQIPASEETVSERLNGLTPRAGSVRNQLPGNPPTFGLTVSPDKLISLKASVDQLTPIRSGNLPTTSPQGLGILNYEPNTVVRHDKSQTFASLKIDPARGPPPAFMPESRENSQVLPSSPPDSTAYSPVRNFVAGPNVPDPFIAQATPKQSFYNGQSQTALRVYVPPTNNVAGPLATALIPVPAVAGPSAHLAIIAPFGNRPPIEAALDAGHLPFVEFARVARPAANYGVVKIRNIPFNCTRSEIVAFMGRNAKILNETEEPIHIVMERVTSKTMEAYVEFAHINDAIAAVDRYDTNRACGRAGRLGERHVDLEISSEDQLLADLFPKATNVRWMNGKARVLPTDPNDNYNTGFKGFISKEELVMWLKHIEAPQRSPFAKECPQRPFETLISTLLKYPWYMVDYITLEDRDLLFDAAKSMVSLLVIRLNEMKEQDSHINDRLLIRIRAAVTRCAGFTEQQKDDIAFLCGMSAEKAGLVPYADHWSVFKTIGPKHDIETDVLLYYVALLRESSAFGNTKSLADRSVEDTFGSDSVFGKVKVDYPQNVTQMSLGQIAKMEWNVIEMLLRQILSVNLITQG